ncbi:hypothetical protein [Comamonas koreensis]|uniref:Uncharacterized protein n=1 Tax=Comamonas koreensis TaxID=160825 RepID=A0AAW4XYD7_9BURK|nr:hypothetical protein [Comamonas koreensis]MCD2166427.1 hypothetical protein [Comamonas koreensis]
MKDGHPLEQGRVGKKRWQINLLIRFHYHLASIVSLAILSLFWADLILNALPLTLTPGVKKEPSLLLYPALWFLSCSLAVKIGMLVVAFLWQMYANFFVVSLNTKRPAAEIDL